MPQPVVRSAGLSTVLGLATFMLLMGAALVTARGAPAYAGPQYGYARRPSAR